MLETPPPSPFQALLGNVKTVLEILGWIIGGLWAYYKFFKGRTFRPRLELDISGKAWRANGLSQLKVSLQIRNVGLSKLEITQQGSALRVFSSVSRKDSAPATVVEWNRLITLAVFEKHKWIEPGETITEQSLLALNGADHRALKLELRIVSQGIEWNSLHIIEPDTGSPTPV